MIYLLIWVAFLQSPFRLAELDRCELREVFQSMGMPIGEQTLNELMDRFDIDNRYVHVLASCVIHSSQISHLHL